LYFLFILFELVSRLVKFAFLPFCLKANNNNELVLAYVEVFLLSLKNVFFCVYLLNDKFMPKPECVVTQVTEKVKINP